MKLTCFRTKAKSHRNRIEDLKHKAVNLGWKLGTIHETIGLNYQHRDLDKLGSTIGVKADRVKVLHDLRTESRRELSALISYSEQHY